MPQRDSRALFREIHRGFVEMNLGVAAILDHFGLPRVSKEDVDKILAEEGITPPVKPPPATAGQLSTGDPVIHRRPHATTPNHEEAQR